jgi:hypothetical protein
MTDKTLEYHEMRLGFRQRRRREIFEMRQNEFKLHGSDIDPFTTRCKTTDCMNVSAIPLHRRQNLDPRLPWALRGFISPGLPCFGAFSAVRGG